jgi:hypothetical protein
VKDGIETLHIEINGGNQASFQACLDFAEENRETNFKDGIDDGLQLEYTCYVGTTECV